MEKTSKAYCNKHPKETVDRVCLDPQCSLDRGPSCPFCLEELHSACQAKMKLKLSRIAEVVSVRYRDFDDSDFYTALQAIVQATFKDLKTEIVKHPEASTHAFKELKDEFAANIIDALNEHEPVVEVKPNRENDAGELFVRFVPTFQAASERH